MAKKKAQPTTDGEIVKPKGLFDHINHLREKQDPNYFDTLSDADQKTWSNFMVCRFLSMQPDLIDLINDIQSYTFLPPREFYKVCLLIVPKGRSYFPFVKGKKDGKWKPELLVILCKYFEECERNVLVYLDILSDDEIRKIVQKYGFSDKEVDKLIKFDVKK